MLPRCPSGCVVRSSGRRVTFGRCISAKDEPLCADKACQSCSPPCVPHCTLRFMHSRDRGMACSAPEPPGRSFVGICRDWQKVGFMHIVGVIIIGFVAGIVAKMLTPGRDPG